MKTFNFLLTIIIIGLVSFNTYCQIEINEAGNVGIGKTPGSYKLDINGLMKLDGNLGIGTDPGTYKLEVFGSAKIHNYVGIGINPSPPYSLLVNGISGFNNVVYFTNPNKLGMKVVSSPGIITLKDIKILPIVSYMSGGCNLAHSVQ